MSFGARLDAREAASVRATLDEIVASGARRVVADLSGTAFVDSSGLATLVRTMTQLRRAGGDLELVRPQDPQAWRVFALTMLDQVFTVVDAAPDDGRRADSGEGG